MYPKKEIVGSRESVRVLNMFFEWWIVHFFSAQWL